VESSLPITNIEAIDGNTKVGCILQAGALNPSDAAAEYQWQSCDTADGVFEDIIGADASAYILTDPDETKYIRVVATGADGYTGTVISAVIGPVEPGTPIIAIGMISGEVQVGSTLTAGLLTPIGATAEFQWLRSNAADGVYEDIEGATKETYTLTGDDINCYIRITATGTDGCTGTAVSDYVGPVAALPSPEPETIPTAQTVIIVDKVSEEQFDPSETTGAGITDNASEAGGRNTDEAGSGEDTSKLTTDENVLKQTDAGAQATSTEKSADQNAEDDIADNPVQEEIQTEGPPDPAETGIESGGTTNET
jgi:hypothetical protein